MRSELWTIASALVCAINATAIWSAYGYVGWALAIAGGVFVMCACYFDGVTRR